MNIYFLYRVQARRRTEKVEFGQRLTRRAYDFILVVAKATRLPQSAREIYSTLKTYINNGIALDVHL